MYAVIKSGGKQHRVIEGETLRLEKLDVATGDSIDFEDVLMVGEGAKVKIGTPNVKGGKVTAEVMAHGRGDRMCAAVTASAASSSSATRCNTASTRSARSRSVRGGVLS